MVPIFPPWKKSTLSTLRARRAPAARREARVAAVCGFPRRLRVCARVCHTAPRCADVRATQENTGAIRQSNAEKPRCGGENPPVREEPASHLASRRCPGVLPNAKYRAEAHTHYFVTKSAARVTPCGRGHSTLRSLAPQFQTKPASLGFCLVEGNERYGGKYAKK